MRRRSKEKQEEAEGQEGGSQEPEGRRKSQRGEGAEGDGAVRATLQTQLSSGRR